MAAPGRAPRAPEPLPGCLPAHGGGDADPRRDRARQRGVRGGPGRRRPGLRGGAVSRRSCTSGWARLDEVVAAVLAGFERGMAGEGRRPADPGPVHLHCHAHRGPVGRDRRAGRPLARSRACRVRHRRAREGLPADPPPRRVSPGPARELPLDDPRRRVVRAALHLGGAPVVRRGQAGSRRPDRGRHHHRRAGRPHLGRLAAYVRDRRVPLEMCPTSNLHTGAVATLADHPMACCAGSASA